MNKPGLDLPTLYKNNATGTGWWKVSLPDDEPPGFLIEYAKSDTAKAVAKFHPTVAKNINRSNQTTGWEQAVLEAESKWRKQLDRGYSVERPAEGERPTNTLGLLKPMLATPFEKIKPETIDWDNAYVQPKLDGHRAMFKDGVLYSRQGKEIDLPHIVEAIVSAGLDHLHLDGEIYWHGKTLQEIGSLIKRPREESLSLKYWLYDVVSDEPYSARAAVFKVAHPIPTLEYWVYDRVSDEPYSAREMAFKASHIPTTDTALEITPTYQVGWQEILNELHTEFKALGYEGTILRHGTTGYEDDKRSRNLIKVKDYDEAEFKIVSGKLGVPYQSEGVEYQCCVYVCECEGGTFDVTAPGTMQEKDAAWRNLYDAIGQMLTVKFWNLSKDRIPQQPVALRIREDV